VSSSTGHGIAYPPTAQRRAVYGIIAIVLVLIVGTLGLRSIEGVSYVNAFYFESMLASGQGPPFALNTDAGKIFASIMGFVSVGAVLTTLVFTLTPIAAQIWREGLERVEMEARRVESDLAAEKEKLKK
jgi:hypothetical protein